MDWHLPVVIGPDAVRSAELAQSLAHARRILVVASARARRSCVLPPTLLADRVIGWFAEFESNPTVDSAMAAARSASELDAQVIIGLGGGSAIDVAKAARALRSGSAPRPSVVAVSTLAGSGAEVTQFATLFKEGRKQSLDSPAILPDLAVVDPLLAMSAGSGPTSASALDALCHAVESAWSRAASNTSLAHSERALSSFADPPWSRGSPLTVEDRHTLATAALHAGAAINETRTTAAHAAAYPLTTRFGIPHGVACALNLRWVARLNMAAVSRAGRAAIENGLSISFADLPDFVSQCLVTAGWPARLREFGVGRLDLPSIAAQAAAEPRMTNNPLRLTADEVHEQLAAVY